MQAFVSCCLAFPGRESGQTQIVIAANRLIERYSYRQQAYLEQQTFHSRVPNPRQRDSNDRRTCFVHTRTSHGLLLLIGRGRYIAYLSYISINFYLYRFLPYISTIVSLSQFFHISIGFCLYILHPRTRFFFSHLEFLPSHTLLLLRAPVTSYLVYLASHISSATLRVAARRKHILTLSCQR